MWLDPEKREYAGFPSFATSANDVLPLLLASGRAFHVYHWPDNPEAAKCVVHILESDLPFARGKSSTVARAACYALLKAHGWTITEQG